MKRKIVVGLVAVFLLVSFAVVGNAAPTKITFVSHSVFWPLLGYGELLDEFMAKTGIEVSFIPLGQKELGDKVSLEWMAGSGAYDVVGWATARFIRDYTQFMEPLNSYTAKASPDWDLNDIKPSTLKLHTFDQNIYGIPIRVGCDILFYRKDLFQKYGVKVPTTWDEFLTAAKTLTLDLDGDGKIDIYGAAFYGDTTYATDIASDIIHSFGGKFVEKSPSGEWRAAINSPEALDALQFLVDLCQKHKVTPPGVATLNNEGLITAVQQGAVAMAIMHAPYFAAIEDPAKSKVVGKIGYAPLPAKAGLSYPGRGWTAGWALCIDKHSKNKEAAWKLVEFLSSKRVALYMATRGNLPARESVYRDAEFQRAVPPGFTEAVSKQLAVNTGGMYTLSAGPNEWVELMGSTFNAVIAGLTTPKDALRELEKGINRSLVRFNP